MPGFYVPKEDEHNVKKIPFMSKIHLLKYSELQKFHEDMGIKQEQDKIFSKELNQGPKVSIEENPDNKETYEVTIKSYTCRIIIESSPEKEVISFTCPSKESAFERLEIEKQTIKSKHGDDAKLHVYYFPTKQEFLAKKEPPKERKQPFYRTKGPLF